MNMLGTHSEADEPRGAAAWLFALGGTVNCNIRACDIRFLWR